MALNLNSFHQHSNDCGYLHIFVTSVTMTTIFAIHQISRVGALCFSFFSPPFSQPCVSLKMLCGPHSALSHLKVRNDENVKGLESLAL